MLVSSGLPTLFWGEAVMNGAWFINLSHFFVLYFKDPKQVCMVRLGLESFIVPIMLTKLRRNWNLEVLNAYSSVTFRWLMDTYFGLEKVKV